MFWGISALRSKGSWHGVVDRYLQQFGRGVPSPRATWGQESWNHAWWCSDKGSRLAAAKLRPIDEDSAVKILWSWDRTAQIRDFQTETEGCSISQTGKNLSCHMVSLLLSQLYSLKQSYFAWPQRFCLQMSACISCLFIAHVKVVFAEMKRLQTVDWDSFQISLLTLLCFHYMCDASSELRCQGKSNQDQGNC